MLFEEAGDWPGLMQAYQRSYPLFKDGNIMIGIPILYGTGGNSKNGTNADFEEMFYNPSAYGLRSYENIYDELHWAFDVLTKYFSIVRDNPIILMSKNKFDAINIDFYSKKKKIPFNLTIRVIISDCFL